MPSLLAAASLAVLTAAAAGAARAAEPASEPSATVSEVVVTARRLDAARQAVEPSLGATSYSLSRQLVELLPGGENAGFNQVLLQAPGGRVLARSQPSPATHPAPRWFAALIDPRLRPVRLGLKGGGALVLQPEPQADLATDWLNFGDIMLVLGLACLLGCGLVFLLIGQALKPLDQLAASFRLIGAGDYQIRVAEGGAKEIAGIGRAFNRMAAQLLGMQGRNRLLEEQLLKLQEEERADLARDLHDEIGPYLFAVSADAEVAHQLIAGGRAAEAPAQIKAIQASVAHMQAQVRDILGRLRPTRVVELGLAPAIADLVEFWRQRRPEIEFETRLQLEEGRLSEDAREAAYRVVQEALSNAVRHGRPQAIRLELVAEDAGGLLVRVRDDGAGDDGEAAGEGGGFGLIGMRERVAQAGGTLSIEPGEDGGGWTVSARLPLAPARRTRRRKAAA